MSLSSTFERARREGRMALIPFLTAGFPDRERFWDTLAAIDAAGADVIEIGVPFSDPVADGPVIEEASRRALAGGVSLAWLIDGLKARRGSFRADLLLMGYTNPFLQYGYERLAKEAKEAGVSGFVVPDMPLEESQTFRAALARHGETLIPLVGLNTPLERMRAYAAVSEGFVYVVSTLGTTGGTNTHLDSIAETMRRSRESFDLPLALGFGLKTPDQLDVLPPDARPDAAVFGSALLDHIDAGQPVEAFFAPWKKKA